MNKLTSIFSLTTVLAFTCPPSCVYATALTTSAEQAPVTPVNLADALNTGLRSKTRADACFLIELQKTDGCQPSAEDIAACTSKGTVERADVAATSRVNLSARAPAQDRQ